MMRVMIMITLHMMSLDERRMSAGVEIVVIVGVDRRRDGGDKRRSAAGRVVDGVGLSRERPAVAVGSGNGDGGGGDWMAMSMRGGSGSMRREGRGNAMI